MKNTDETSVDIASLWNKYHEKKALEIRDQLVEIYLPLVNIIAGRVSISLPAHIDKDDLISSGFFGLLDAIDRYDLTRGNKFETYAGVRIRGAMLDYLRSKDWISVSLRQKIRKYEQSVSVLEGELGRSATDQEIADKLGISTENLHVLLQQLNVATIIPLEEYVRTESPQTYEADPAERAELHELQATLAAAIDKLPEKEKTVVSLYYYEELTLKEISVILKLSEARICQLHTKAIFRLRGYLSRAKASLV